MSKKINVALIYKNNYPFLNENHFDKTTYYFFMKALGRNEDLEVSYFPCDNRFDCSKLKSKADIILLPYDGTYGTPEELIGIKELEIPVICRTGDPHRAKRVPKDERDPHQAKRYNRFQFRDKWKIDYYFNFMHEEYFYKFYPRDFKYRTITFGVEPGIYENLNYDFKKRRNDKILNSGALGKSNLKSRIANRILNPERSGWYFYKLRTLCNNLEFVTHTAELEKEFPSCSYPELLSKYCTAIAATTFYPTIKYWESSAAGCLTFMEITELNRGKYLGYEDGENAIFINENNYKEKFQNYLSDSDNSNWSEIAKAGHDYTMKRFSNDEAVKELVNLIKEIL